MLRKIKTYRKFLLSLGLTVLAVLFLENAYHLQNEKNKKEDSLAQEAQNQMQAIGAECRLELKLRLDTLYAWLPLFQRTLEKNIPLELPKHLKKDLITLVLIENSNKKSIYTNPFFANPSGATELSAWMDAHVEKLSNLGASSLGLESVEVKTLSKNHRGFALTLAGNFLPKELHLNKVVAVFDSSFLKSKLLTTTNSEIFLFSTDQKIWIHPKNFTWTSMAPVVQEWLSRSPSHTHRKLSENQVFASQKIGWGEMAVAWIYTQPVFWSLETLWPTLLFSCLLLSLVAIVALGTLPTKFSRVTRFLCPTGPIFDPPLEEQWLIELVAPPKTKSSDLYFRGFRTKHKVFGVVLRKQEFEPGFLDGWIQNQLSAYGFYQESFEFANFLKRLSEEWALLFQRNIFEDALTFHLDLKNQTVETTRAHVLHRNAASHSPLSQKPQNTEKTQDKVFGCHSMATGNFAKLKMDAKEPFLILSHRWAHLQNGKKQSWIDGNFGRWIWNIRKPKKLVQHVRSSIKKFKTTLPQEALELFGVLICLRKESRVETATQPLELDSQAAMREHWPTYFRDTA